VETQVHFIIWKKKQYMVGSNIEIAKMLILKEFDFLEEQDYEPKFNVNEDTTSIESASIIYCNKVKKLEIEVNYRKSKVYEEIKYSFDLSIMKIPYTNVHDFFSLWLYLETIKNEISTSMINYFDKHQAEIILRNLSNAPKKYASNIINGTEWKNDYWPRW